MEEHIVLDNTPIPIPKPPPVVKGKFFDNKANVVITTILVLYGLLITGVLPTLLFGFDEFGVMLTIPKYPGGAKEYVATYETGFPESDYSDVARNFFSNDLPSKVFQFYYSSLTKNGWTLESSSNNAQGEIVVFSKIVNNQRFKFEVSRYPVNANKAGNYDRRYALYILTMKKIR